jgi:hypothetical protein
VVIGMVSERDLLRAFVEEREGARAHDQRARAFARTRPGGLTERVRGTLECRSEGRFDGWFVPEEARKNVRAR